MHKRPLPGTRRTRLGIAALAVLSIAATGGMSTSARSPERAPGGPTDTQSGQPDARPEFAGDYAADGLGATAGPDDPNGKSEGLGEASNAASAARDVPGASVASDAAAAPGASVSTHRVGSSDADLAAAVANGATARLIVMTRTQVGFEGQMSASAVAAQHSNVDKSLSALGASLKGTGSKKVSELDSIPSAVYEVNAKGLKALLANPNVASISLDGQVEGMLASSTSVIDSDLLNSAGVLGNDWDGSAIPQWEVAIIDSGVDNQHNAFLNGGNRIVAQACFVDDIAPASTNCPNGLNSQIGGNAGDNCTHSTDCNHGTHVGGTAAGTLYTGGHEGVAGRAGIVAINIASDSPTSTRWTASFSDINQALQHVLNLANGARPNIVALNMSIGTAATFADGAACDNVSPATTALMLQLRNAGVAPVVAAGNSSSQTQMSYPGCASSALAVGATDDANVPAAFSNSSPGLEWWAPGVSIDAPVPTGNAHAVMNGTSMATPHVTGSFALLSECIDPASELNQTTNQIIADLNATGVNVTRNGVTRKRINVLDAATRNVNNNDFAFPENLNTIFGGPSGNDIDWTVCSDTEPGEPGPFSLDNGNWWRWTAPTTGVVTISTEDGPAQATTFDTTLAVYTGATLGTLQLRAFDDDSGTGLRSLVTLGVNAGTTYRIKVDGFAAQNGRLNLRVSPITPVACQGVNATLVGGPLADNIVGTAGNDVIVSFGGNDVINGLAGNDRICSDAGSDNVRGFTGDDRVFGGPDADVIRGEDGVDVLLGNAGGGDNNDVGDTIDGGLGNDILDGWVGNDVLIGGPGNDRLIGAVGTDTASYLASANPVSASLTTNTATGDGSDTFSAVENLFGSAFNDVLVGSGVVNVLRGVDGSDTLNGLAGNDSEAGGTGLDVIRGGDGDDSLFGEAGNDRLFGEAGNDRHNGGADFDRCDGGAGAGDTQTLCEVVFNIP